MTSFIQKLRELSDKIPDVEFGYSSKTALVDMMIARGRAIQDVSQFLINHKEAIADVAEKAKTYFDNYCQDEAADDGVEMTGCGQRQHEEAKALGDALAKLEASQ